MPTHPFLMSDAPAAGDGKVSGNQASIPAPVRRALGIDDGDLLHWEVVNGELRVSIVRRGPMAFDDFTPGQSAEPVDVVEEHDRFGVA